MSYGRHIRTESFRYAHMASMPILTSPAAQVYRWRWVDRLMLGRRCPVCHVRLRHRGHDERHAAVVACSPGPHLHFEVRNPDGGGYIVPERVFRLYGRDFLDEVNRGDQERE
jgi:hypothetical protein